MKEAIAVIGAGLMGRGLCQLFAIPGHQVKVYDASAEALSQAQETIAQDLQLAAEAALLSEDEVEKTLARITPHAEMAAAVAGARLVVDCAPENMELKQDIFKKLDAICPPEVILTSNTSAMSISAIAGKCNRPNRVAGTHFWNPPQLIPLVEVIQGQHTSPQVIRETMRILSAAGKEPIHVKKDVPGFVGNRLQHAMWREAFHILDEGIADAATIDKAIRHSFGLRLPVLGPMENVDMVGVDLVYAVHDYLFKHLADNKTPSPSLRQLMAKGELGFKSGGKGIQEWSPAAVASSRANLFRYLLEVAVRRKDGQFWGAERQS
jgi:3-hydroxybutyryl-CoA dehydrogenase